MKSLLTPIWIISVMTLLAYLVIQATSGMELRTSLMVLLPDKQRDPAVEHAMARVSTIATRQVIFLIGHEDAVQSKEGSKVFTQALSGSNLFESVSMKQSDSDIDALTAAYQNHAGGLLSSEDRNRLNSGQGTQIVQRSIAQVFGGFSPIDGALLRKDPFLLLPSFLMGLHQNFSNLRVIDGIVTIQNGDETWVLIRGHTKYDPMSVRNQKSLLAAISEVETSLPDGTRVLRSGALFFAAKGADTAISEASQYGSISLAGVVLLILLIFRSIGPLLLNVLAILVGIATGCAIAIAVFGELHVITLLFGSSLIGVSVDYGLHYCCQRFSSDIGGLLRLKRILPGLLLGLVTTVLGYICMVAAPLPGLQQLAVFTVSGLVFSFLTVVIWFPRLDRSPPRPLPAYVFRNLQSIWKMWENLRFQWLILTGVFILTIPGLLQLQIDDDVRHLQPLDRELLAEQKRIAQLTGFQVSKRFLLINAPDDEAALQLAERLAPKLNDLVSTARLAGWQGPSKWVMSKFQQVSDRLLIEENLNQPFMSAQLERLGLESESWESMWVPLLPEHLSGFAPFSSLVIGPGRHLITLSGLKDAKDINRIADTNSQIIFVDAADEISKLLKRYRLRAQYLLGLAMLLTMLVFMWRYGVLGGLQVFAPPLLGITAALSIGAMLGVAFTLFSVLALILVMAVGGDYAIFCRESDRSHRIVTLLAIILAGTTTTLSFGMLSMSSVAAVHQFGTMMLVGTIVSVVFAPFAYRAEAR